ncbi:MAG: AraC family transcriptional regulator [Stackebrandtia sp.]
MDPFSDLLRGVHGDGAGMSRFTLSSPWSLRFADGVPLTMLTVMRGAGWLAPTDGEPVRLGQWDTAIVRGPQPFHFADEPDSAAKATVSQDVRCRDHCGQGVARRTAGSAPSDPDGQTVLLIGWYQAHGGRHERLLRALPQVLTIAESQESRQIIRVVAESAADQMDAQVVLDRFLDMGLVCTLRTWFDQQAADAPGWYRGMTDDVVGPALAALHAEPARPWTVATLASEAGVSRALLAKRFSQVIGQPPLSYLTEWRMALAEELLAEPDATVAAVARKVGYSDGFAFSTAFKRVRGASPSDHRAAALAAA